MDLRTYKAVTEYFYNSSHCTPMILSHVILLSVKLIFLSISSHPLLSISSYPIAFGSWWITFCSNKNVLQSNKGVKDKYNTEITE